MIDYYIRKLYGSLEVSYDPTKTYPLEGAFSREIKISTKSSSFIIPVFALGALADFSVEEANNIDSIVISLPSLYLEKYAITEKRANDIFSLVKNFTLEDRLCKIVTTKCIYYVGQGVILDSDFNPLLVCTLKVTKGAPHDNFIFTYSDPTVYISPKVFASKDLISKAIVKTLIPSCGELLNTAYSSSLNIHPSDDIPERINLSILDFNVIITPPVKFNKYSDEYLQEVVRAHVDDIVDDL